MKRSLAPFILILFFVLMVSASTGSASKSAEHFKPAKAHDEMQYSLHEKIETALHQLSLNEKIGQLFIVAADGSAEQLAAQSRKYHLGGYIFFARHTPTLAATMQKIEQVRSATRLYPFIAVDQEGGRVARLSYTTPIPPAASLASLSAQSVYCVADLLGRELRLLGFNVNFAPVMDVNTYQSNPVIGDRAFSQDPYLVARLGSSFIQGLQAHRVAAAAKHFPGHGDTRLDSHYELPIVTHNADRLDRIEIMPFRAAIRTGSAMIMAAHVYYPALEPVANLPASLSGRILTQLLREELGYHGIIITDAMNMQAVTRSHSAGNAAVASFLAGADILLMPQNLEEAFQAIFIAVEQGIISIDRLNDSVRRILRLKFWLQENERDMLPFNDRLTLAQKLVGSAQHRRLMNHYLQNLDIIGDSQD